MTKPISQIEAVQRAMTDLGGYATLAQLYHQAPHIEGSSWGTKTPFASIRRIVQTSGRFWKIRPGLWALNSEEERIRSMFEIPLAAAPNVTETFDHSYYQGLLLELGRFEGFETSVPSQDQNRLFLEKPLREIATYTTPPAFTFEHLLRFASTIDAGWYNSRRFPHAFFEVEHSTDIQNSLLKFLEFQDLRTRFVIVADELRRREWEDKMNRQAFADLKNRVDFLSYENLSRRHSTAAERMAAREASGF